jgi:hypothetical protein
MQSSAMIPSLLQKSSLKTVAVQPQGTWEVRSRAQGRAAAFNMRLAFAFEMYVLARAKRPKRTGQFPKITFGIIA